MPQNARLNPALVETHVASVNWLNADPHDANIYPFSAQLSFIQILPAFMDNSGSAATPPVVLTVRSRAAGEGNFQMPESIFDRWEAVEFKQAIDPAFEQLGNRRNNISAEPTSKIKLRRLESAGTNKVVIGLQVIHFGKILLLTMSDGSLEYRDRFTFGEVYASQNLSKIMNMRQAGWSFCDVEPCKLSLSAHPERNYIRLSLTTFRPTSCCFSNWLLDGTTRR